MVDLDFERRAALLTNDGYFDRVRELGRTMGVRESWEQVERELPLGLQRFSTFKAFENARKKELQRTISTPTFKYFDAR